jgi:hypothetical protein
VSTEVLTFNQQTVRGTDSNSLLRMYDLANETFRKSQLQQERARPAKVILRLAKELQKRNVPVGTGHE